MYAAIHVDGMNRTLEDRTSYRSDRFAVAKWHKWSLLLDVFSKRRFQDLSICISRQGGCLDRDSFGHLVVREPLCAGDAGQFCSSYSQPWEALSNVKARPALDCRRPMSRSPIAEAVVQIPPPTMSRGTSRARQMPLSAIILDVEP
jgi:hypothetical protein